jgi:hypothetical protein
MLIVDAQIQCVTLFTQELPWLKGRDLELKYPANGWVGPSPRQPRLKRQLEGAALPIALMAFDGAPAPSKHLARSVALVGKQAPATGTGATINRDAGIGCRGGLLGQPLPPQLLHAATDCFEIVSCSGP